MLQVCRATFDSRAGKLDGVKAEAEDVFRLVAWLLDSLMSYTESHVQQDINDLYADLTKTIREWKSATVKDRELISDSVFRIIRKLLGHHWDTYYSDYLYDLFTTTIEFESAIKYQAEQERFQKRLSDFSDILDVWINTDYNGHLSQEIELVVADKLTADIKPLKPNSGRKTHHPSSVMASFSYLPEIDNRSQRLKAFYDCLNRVFIDCDQQVFINIFQGTTTTEKILWIRDIKDLHYLIDHLEKWLKWPISYDKWVMTCARFNIRKKVKKKIDDSMTNDSREIEDLKISQFNKGGKVPKEHDELDRIIRILDPKTNLKNVLQDYLDYVDAQGEHDDIEDYRDALANDLNICSHL